MSTAQHHLLLDLCIYSQVQIWNQRPLDIPPSVTNENGNGTKDGYGNTTTAFNLSKKEGVTPALGSCALLKRCRSNCTEYTTYYLLL